MNTYKGLKTTLEENEVFVFGSNSENGFHGAGAAGYATFNEFGNVWREYGYQGWPKGTKGKWNVKGVSEGPMLGTEGKSYAIPTVTRAGAKRSIPLADIKKSIEKFYAFAESRPHLKFFVAQENKTGLNGYLPTELAEIYSGEIPENVYFDEGFAKLLKKKIRYCEDNYVQFEMFGKSFPVKKRIIQNNKQIDSNEWDEELWVERPEEMYALMSPELINKRVLVVQAEEWRKEMTMADFDKILDAREQRKISPKPLQGLKTIVAGSRSISDYELVCTAIKESNFKIAEIVSGTAKGVDSLGERWAEENNIPVKRFPAPWDDVKDKPENEIGQNSFGKKYWKRAGAFRNQQMADYADALIAITTGSSGTADMINRAEKKGLKVFVKNVSLCESCEKHQARPLHTCPYAEEINNSSELCNCCEKCEHECCMDI